MFWKWSFAPCMYLRMLVIHMYVADRDYWGMVLIYGGVAKRFSEMNQVSIRLYCLYCSVWHNYFNVWQAGWPSRQSGWQVAPILLPQTLSIYGFTWCSSMVCGLSSRLYYCMSRGVTCNLKHQRVKSCEQWKLCLNWAVHPNNRDTTSENVTELFTILPLPIDHFVLNSIPACY